MTTAGAKQKILTKQQLNHNNRETVGKSVFHLVCAKGLYKGVSKSIQISSVVCQQMAAQGCAQSYSDFQSW
jgi:hypothetical protein